ncbi:MAG TPA: tRNA (adenosine(37)-N6)-threonylcarbamoyltransferase complex ATPase subunit type 1 TsaE [Actinomycetota bacterium]|nr:tRNA (adenosine(37)-N6)-threonylcarbamoyltransferase complex ATPase subunit type 1 TsaE [Actinomycetota bacterium]
MFMEIETETADRTREVGQAVASLLQPRDTVVLTGDLGAGKTTFVQGIGRGLGVEDHVASPTFTLVREYTGRLDVAHVDVYRLERVQDVLDLALDELGGPERVLLVEWGDAVSDLLPEDRLRVELTTARAETDTRRIVITPQGRSWAGRWERLEHALESFRGNGGDATLGGTAR